MINFNDYKILNKNKTNHVFQGWIYNFLNAYSKKLSMKKVLSKYQAKVLKE